jgi:hypothetical protein
MSEILCCISSSISIIEQLIDIHAKIKNNDNSAMNDLIELVEKYPKCNKKEKILIRNTLKKFLECNISNNNSTVSLETKS